MPPLCQNFRGYSSHHCPPTAPAPSSDLTLTHARCEGCLSLLQITNDWEAAAVLLLPHGLTFRKLLLHSGSPSVPVRGRPFMSSGFQVSSPDGHCFHKNIPPTLQHLFLTLHTILHRKDPIVFLWPLCPSIYIFTSYCVIALFLKVSCACCLHFFTSYFIFNPQIHLHPSQSPETI